LFGIANVLGEGETDNWPGKTIVLYPEPMIVTVRAKAAVNGNGKATA
jgi:hypothetical protein